MMRALKANVVTVPRFKVEAKILDPLSALVAARPRTACLSIIGVDSTTAVKTSLPPNASKSTEVVIVLLKRASASSDEENIDLYKNCFTFAISYSADATASTKNGSSKEGYTDIITCVAGVLVR